jgi:hypothetical protein
MDPPWHKQVGKTQVTNDDLLLIFKFLGPDIV